MHVALELGRSWGAPLDTLRRHHVCELYNSGFDALAEEVCDTEGGSWVKGGQCQMQKFIWF